MTGKLLKKLKDYLPSSSINSLDDCVNKLYKSLPNKENLSKNTVMVAYGGGKDSAYSTAYMRTVHLAVAEKFAGNTFKLKIVTMRHPGMPFVVMENIHRTYTALELYDDLMVELLLIERDHICSFNLNAPMPQPVINFTRIDVLMSGHRSFGDGRTTFCNACNFNVANSFGLSAAHNGGVDIIVTGDSPSEQKDYALWIRKLACETGVTCSKAPKFKGVLETIDALARIYAVDIHGNSQKDRIDSRRVSASVSENLQFFSIYNYTDYASGEHWNLLTNFLGFVFDDVAFSFTETDCANPALMAHLRGLRVEHVYHRSYKEGIRQYVDFALDLMVKKDFPDYLIMTVKNRYATDDGIQSMRKLCELYAEQIFGLTAEQLVCMVYSPFLDEGAFLHDYLLNEQPKLLNFESGIHSILSGEISENIELASRLETMTGLSINDLQILYRSPMWELSSNGNKYKLLSFVTKHDPNQKIIKCKKEGAREEIIDRVSGR